MQSPRVTQGPERMFMVIKNVDADSITTGMGVRIVGGAAAEIVSTDGVAAVKITTDAFMSSLVGIAVQDIPANTFGRVQTYGIVNSVLLSAEADKTVGVTGLANTFLKVGAVAGSFTSTQTPQANSTFAYKYLNNLATTNISGGLNYTKAFVRAI